jgi:hypothetical protein
MADRIKSRYPGVYYRLDAGGNRRYCVSFRGSDGKRHWETVAGGEADARARKAELERKLSRGEPVQASKVLFEKFTNDWLAGQTQLKPKTIELYSSALDVHLIPRFGKMQVQKISKEHVADFIGELVGKGLKAWTIRGIITPLRGRWATPSGSASCRPTR